MTTLLMNWTETHWYPEWSIPIERDTDRVPFTLQVPMNTTQPPRSSILFFSLWTRNKTLVRTLPVDWFTELCTVINIPFTFNQPPFDTHYILAHCSQRKPFYWQCFMHPGWVALLGIQTKGTPLSNCRLSHRPLSLPFSGFHFRTMAIMANSFKKVSKCRKNVETRGACAPYTMYVWMPCSKICPSAQNNVQWLKSTMP